MKQGDDARDYTHEDVIELVRAARFALGDIEDFLDGTWSGESGWLAAVDSLGDALAAFKGVD